MSWFAQRLVALCMCCIQGLWAQQPAATRLTIAIVEGRDASHSIGTRTAAGIVIEVRDSLNKPVPGAQVRFELPATGPGGTFPGNTRSLEVTTNTEGRAAAAGFVPNALPGAFAINVVATANGQTAQSSILQKNAVNGFNDGIPVAKERWKWWVAGLVAAGAGVGLTFALRGGADPARPGFTPGSPVIGGPR